MKHLSIFFGILIVLSASRFIPHPPNFTSLLALSFYVPALLGLRYLPALLISFAITDMVIGYHTGTFFTWGSVFLIGLMANSFSKTLTSRLSGALIGAVIFFTITNFGVWASGMYGYTMTGLISCYTLAIPFFAYSVISTIVFSFIIEIFYKSYQLKILKHQ
jgi:hypothetical protein|tara:strand:- start:761 stop:1246 length:486 start_codon:yes stop_codon:yes gene_type:complete